MEIKETIKRWARRIRAALSFMSDLGGSIIFLGLATALVVGGVFVALDFLDGVALILVASGLALAAFWAVSYFVGPKLREQPILPVPVADAENPFVRARQFQHRYREDQERERVEQQRLGLLRAIREIREELLDNKRVIEEAREADSPELFRAVVDAWNEYGPALRDHGSAEAHRAVREAYRRVRIAESGLADFNLTPDDRRRIGGADAAIIEAVHTLDQEESQS